MLDTLRLHLKRAFIFLCNLNPAAYRQFTKFLILDHVTSHVTSSIQNNKLRQEETLVYTFRENFIVF